MLVWTDYPFTELGDIPNVEAPVRQVELKHYDGDKYCKIKVGRKLLSVKAGYLYLAEGRLGKVPSITRAQLSKFE